MKPISDAEMEQHYEKDVEVGKDITSGQTEIISGESFEYGHGRYAKLMRLAGKYGIEQRGIERVPEDERTDIRHPYLNTATMWLSTNLVVSSFALGILGQSIFQMGVIDSMLTLLFFNFLGILPVCYFSTFGMKFGLRQMVLSRFWVGWWVVKLFAFFNIIACIGWASVNSIVGAQLIHAVNPKVDGAVGIVIIAVCTFAICLFGYKVVHAYEFWSWIPVFIIFLIVLGVFAHSGDYRHIPMGIGKAELGNVLSFGSIIFGFATGWSSVAADYTVYQRSSNSRTKVFFSTFIGLIIPLLFTQMLAVAIFSATSINDGDNIYAKGYAEAKIGGLFAAVLFPKLHGFGKFCQVILALSIIGNNIPNTYSVALTMQVLGRWTQRVPRFIWTGVATGIYIAIAIPGYSRFEQVLQNFMDLIGYWLAIYEGISLTEHFVFIGSMSNYRPEDYDKPTLLPPGFAAMAAFCFGIVGMVIGMHQIWWVGPVAKCAGGSSGGDVGFELSFAFAVVTYLISRPIEKRIFGR